jgi:DNA-directed RNA polymerase subunit beta
MKFQRSNQNTCINQRPLVKVGDVVNAGDVIRRRPVDRARRASARPQRAGRVHALERLQFRGFHLISERIVKDDVFTSIHIEEFEVMARDTKLGPEDITRDIPNVGEEALRNLDEAGIVYIGAEVEPGDILVGKITPRAKAR